MKRRNPTVRRIAAGLVIKSPVFVMSASLALAILLLSVREATAVCLNLETSDQTVTHSDVAGAELRVTFSHSIYGSEVQEEFRIIPTGFEPAKLRYAELRLVEFYGHESARREGSWWVVQQTGRAFPLLDFQVSRDSWVRIGFGNRAVTISDGSARLSVGACPY